MFGMQMGKMGGVGQMTLAQRIAYMFGSGEQGAWYDPSDLSTLFQDSAGTTPVTAVEQPVGRMLDKSGRGNHATQATTTKRPVLKIDAVGCYYLSFDGVDDALQTSSIDFTGTDKMTVWAGVTKLSDAAAGVIAHAGVYDGSPGFLLSAPTGAGAPNAGFRVRRGTLGPLVALSGTGAPSMIVATGSYDGVQTVLRVNGAQATDTASVGAGTFASKQLSVGAQDGVASFFNGRLYNLIVRGAQSSQSQIENSELYVKQKMRLP